MNYSVIIYMLGWVLNFEGFFLSLPCIVALIYGEESGFAYLGVMGICLLLGTIAVKTGKKESVFFAKEGFVTVALSWILLSIFGALPFFISGEIPFFVNALFESVSGFSTTGASILTDVETLSRASLFWRSFTHWIGGMGVLVFILAILPLAGGYNMHLMKAESPGPQVGKLVPRVRKSALILYAIYCTITVTQIILLLVGGMPLFDALTISFGTTGTGGFSIKKDSMAGYSDYLQGVVTTFMILSGINFSVYYLLLIKKVKIAFKSEEVRIYLIIISISTVVITYSIKDMYSSFFTALHHAVFQVGSIITSTGYTTTDYNTWPEVSKTILLLLMFTGACAGSTGGGIKVSRIIIAFKTVRNEIDKFIHPRSVKKLMLDGRIVDSKIQNSVLIFFAAYIFIYAASLIIISFDNYDFTTEFTAVSAALNNIGPGLGRVGPVENFNFFSPLSKFVLMFNMLAGRLELFPMLVLFSHRTWKK